MDLSSFLSRLSSLGLLERADALAKRRRISRAERVAEALRGVLSRAATPRKAVS